MYEPVIPHVTTIGCGDPIPKGWVRRNHPVFPEFVRHCSWWPNQIHQRNGTPEMVYLWIPKEDNLAYERGRKRTRFCVTYRGKSCEHITGRVIVAVKC